MNTELTHISNDISNAVGSLPPTMSMPLSRAMSSLKDGKYKDTLIHFLDFFEMSVQWLNCYLLALACQVNEGRKIKGIERAVRMIDTKRPLSFGDCVNEIFNPLLDTLAKLYPDHPLILSLVKNVKSRRKDLLVGSAKETGIIKIRNDYKGHSTSLSENIYYGVVESILPKLASMIEGLAPLKDANIFTVDSHGATINLHGGWNSNYKSGAREGNPYHYYVGFHDVDVLDLYPLILQRDDRYIYVFQTLKGESVKYESSDENVHGIETDDYNQPFDAFLQRLVPSFDIAKETNWSELCEIMRVHSMSHMIQVQKEKKYNSELFVDRKRLTDMLRRFELSTCSLLPLAGDAGQGKTNQMCYWTERFINDNHPVMIFNCASFSEASLSDTFKSIFGISHRRPLKRLLDHMHSKAIENSKTIFFFFDAINECLHYKNDSGIGEENQTIEGNAPLLLYRDIVGNLVNSEYPKFKVVTTCRSYTWKNQILPGITFPKDMVFGNDDDELSYIVGFTDDETENAYRKYEELYQMTTPFSQLDRRIMLRLRDPLIMKFVCSNYVGSLLSVRSNDYTSINLFSKMYSDIRDHSFAGRRQCILMEEMSRIFLHSYLEGYPSGSINNTDLRNAFIDQHSPLHSLSHLIYRKDGLTAAYTELRNKPDRPILREVEKTVNGERVRSIEFIYERFLEYMMARVFLLEADEKGKTLNADDFLDVFKRGSVNVVFLGAMRNALIMETIRRGDFSIMIDLISHHNDKPGIMDLINDVIDVMIRENYEDTLFPLIDLMISSRPEDPELIRLYNEVKQEIASNKATSQTIVRHNEFSVRLQPVVNLKNSAIVAVNNLLLSDFFNENLCTGDVLGLLWKLIMDDITDVSNETCKFVYYLSRRKYTLGHTLLNTNLTKKIVKEMYREIQSRTIVGNMVRRNERRKSLVFVEAATRLAVLLIIDATISPCQDVEMITEMLNEIKGIAGYFTWRYRFMKAIMPFLQTIMRKQITFQSVYVNNAIEYQGFWNEDIVPSTAPEGKWCRPRLRDAMDFVGLFNRHHHDPESEDCLMELERFRALQPVIVSAYQSGCSFSYFIMERIMIIAGCTDWQSVRPIIKQLLDEEFRDFEWFDYMQMSLQYSLLQLQIHSLHREPEILKILTDQARDWTLRCRGLFEARHSHKANPTGLYKRNVINWYCVAYCVHTGDNVAHDGDSRPVPLLYELIDLAVDNYDKELLMHLLDNISELISDFGYVKTALGALKYVMMKYDSKEEVEKLDSVKCNRNRFAKENLISKIGSVLSTAKTYHNAETESFLRSEVIGMKFPGVESYREEILNYHPSGETLSDLFTHKFGNFLLWSLLHEKQVDDFSHEAVCSAIESKDCFAWFDHVIRILCRRMFNVKL